MSFAYSFEPNSNFMNTITIIVSGLVSPNIMPQMRSKILTKSETQDISAKQLESLSVKLPIVSFSRDIIEEDGSDTRSGYC